MMILKKQKTTQLLGYHRGKLVNQLIPVKTAKQRRSSSPYPPSVQFIRP